MGNPILISVLVDLWVFVFEGDPQIFCFLVVFL